MSVTNIDDIMNTIRNFYILEGINIATVMAKDVTNAIRKILVFPRATYTKENTPNENAILVTIY